MTLRPLSIIFRVSFGENLNTSWKKTKTGLFNSLQLIILEFDIDGTPKEPTIIHYFWESFKLFIKVEIKQQNCASTSFEEMVQQAVNVEAKTGLQSITMI